MSPLPATEPERIWVDASGLHAVRARLMAVEDDRVLLLRSDGGETRIDLSQLSERDKEYVAAYSRQRRFGENALRIQPPAPREIAPLPRLRLPAAESVAPEGSALVPARSAISATGTLPSDPPRPQPMAADRSPDSINVPLAQIEVGKVDAYEICSQIFAVQRSGGPSLAMSISNGYSFPGENMTSRLVRFDLATEEMNVVWQSDEPITLIDHHDFSGRSLVLVGHDPRGHGGQLALAEGWHTESVVVHHQRSIPQSSDLNRSPHVRWAKWIDAEHVIAAIDGSLAAWNVMSGKPLYRVDGIDPRGVPALSGGRRYVAVPGPGFVNMFQTDTGASLGRIEVKSNSLPSASFSPLGDALAIATSRRLRVWDLITAESIGDIESRRSLGRASPVWVDNDLVLSGSGTLISVFRGLPLWHYDLTSTTARSVGDHVVMFRRHPTAELDVISVPHEAAESAIKWIDMVRSRAQPDRWAVLGRSDWSEGKWNDRDLRVDGSESDFR